MTSGDEPIAALNENWRDANVPAGFTLTAVGDLVIDDVLSPRLNRESPALTELLHSADVTFGNFESTALDPQTFDGWPEAESGGSWLISSPRVPEDLAALGFNIVSRANNHTTDFGVAGMRSTNTLLTRAGIMHAGSGETLAAARAPRFLHVPAGRVSLVAAASRFTAASRATDPLGEFRGRPGVNALRTTRKVVVPPEQLRHLTAIRDAQPVGSVRPSVAAADERSGSVTLFDTTYVAGAESQHTPAIQYTLHEQDRAATVEAVRQAKQTSDFTIVSIHTHEPGNYSDTPPDFLPQFARDAIDNGADAVIGHGPHRLRGIEIYRQRPIFYSLGNFFFMENTQQPLTRDAYEKAGVEPEAMTEAEFLERKRVHGVFGDRVWYESVVAESVFDERGNLREVRLHPIEMHWQSGRDADRGIPAMAAEEANARIVRELQTLSKEFGTTIDLEDHVGVIRVIAQA